VRRSELRAAMRDCWQQARREDEAHLEQVRTLQKADRNYGCVELVKDTSKADRLMAVKRMPNAWVCDGPKDFDRRYPMEPEKPWREIGLLRVLNDRQYPHACKLYGVFRGAKDTLVATSFCEEGDLGDWCFRSAALEPGPEREATIRPLVVQVCKAIRWLHNLGIAHCDLSLENVLVSRSEAGTPVLKLIDFGMATLKRRKRLDLCGKAIYQAPEVHSGGAVDTFLVDAFAVGVTLFTLAARRYPWSRTQIGACAKFGAMVRFGPRGILDGDSTADGPQRSDVFSAEFWEVLGALLVIEPRARACIGEAAFQPKFWRRPRRSIFDFAFMQDMPVVSPSPAEAAPTVSADLCSGAADASVGAASPLSGASTAAGDMGKGETASFERSCAGDSLPAAPDARGSASTPRSGTSPPSSLDASPLAGGAAVSPAVEIMKAAKLPAHSGSPVVGPGGALPRVPTLGSTSAESEGSSVPLLAAGAPSLEIKAPASGGSAESAGPPAPSEDVESSSADAPCAPEGDGERPTQRRLHF